VWRETFDKFFDLIGRAKVFGHIVGRKGTRKLVSKWHGNGRVKHGISGRESARTSSPHVQIGGGQCSWE